MTPWANFLHSVDDGTGVIECAHRHPVQAPSIPTKHIPGKREVRSTASAILDKYRRPQNSESAKVPPRQENSPPKPIAEIGGSVRVVGRVIKKFETRSIYADEIGG